MPDPEPTPRTAKWWEDFLPTNWRKIVAWIVLCGIITLVNWLSGLVDPDRRPIPIPDPADLFLVIPAGTEIDQAELDELERRGVKVRFTGWVAPTEDEISGVQALLTEPRWEMTDAAGFGAGPDDDAPVWRLYTKVAGQPIPAHDQGQIGSCVSFGTALANELSLAAKIHGKRGPPQQFALTVREAIYGGSRINADPRNPIRGGDGSTGARAAKWGRKGVGGALPIGSYGPYSVQRCRQWGDRGVPPDAVKLCQENPYTSTLVTSANAAREALQQGYAIFVCSDQGFANQRDQEGFLQPRGKWMHCMCIAGYRGDRKGFLIVNSWGERWVSGPTGKFQDIPPGSFWAEASVVDRMLRQSDSYAVTDVDGFRRRKINPDDWIVAQPRPFKEVDHVFALAP
jgi:hypothetical protein